MSDQPLAQHKRLGFSLTVWPNRIEVEQVGALAMKKREVIPLRNVTAVERHAASSRITVRTNDGKKHTWATGFDTAKIYDAIMSAL